MQGAHAPDLLVELRNLLLVEILGHLDEGGAFPVGAALLVPVRLRSHELSGPRDVDAAKLAQEQVLQTVLLKMRTIITTSIGWSMYSRIMFC